MNPQNSIPAALPPETNAPQPDAPAPPPLRRPRRSPRRKPRTPRRTALLPIKRRLSWAQLKALLDDRLGRLNPVTLKQVLIAGGIAVAAATVIITLCQFVPVGLALLVVLGLGLVLQFWKEIRRVLTFA